MKMEIWKEKKEFSAMNKRGQIYLLAALILGLIIFLVVAETNLVKETVIEDDFESLAKNYEVESAKFMNSLLAAATPPDIPQEFLKFTIVFSSYAKTKNPEFGIIYAFIYNNHLYVGNYLDREVRIPGAPPLNLPGCYQRLNTEVVVAGFPLQYDVLTSAYSSCRLDIFPVPSTNSFTFFIEDTEYEVELEPFRPEIIIVSR